MVTWLNLGCKTVKNTSQPNPISTQFRFQTHLYYGLKK